MSFGIRLRKVVKKGFFIFFKMFWSVGFIISGDLWLGLKGFEFEIKSILWGIVSYLCFSLMCSESGRFRDIFDVYFEFKFFDFWVRVKVVGVKDYGEDVVERNMGENGFDLELEYVKVFYNSYLSVFWLRRLVFVFNLRSLRYMIWEV